MNIKKSFLSLFLLLVSFNAYSEVYTSSASAYSACRSFQDYAFSIYGVTGVTTDYCTLNVGTSTWTMHINNGYPTKNFIFSAQYVSCSSIGFDPSASYPDGFCPNAPDSNSSSPESICDNNGSNSIVTPCLIKTCSDGSFSTSTSPCPDISYCPDGSVDYGFGCDETDTFVCSDGTVVTNSRFCQDPTQQNKICADGQVIPENSICPTTVDAICADGSVVSNISLCPEQPAPHSDTQNKTCWDGSQTQGECPPQPDSTPSTINDSSSSTTTTTTINSDGSTSTSTSVTNNEIDLAATNARLDKIIENDKDFRGKPNDYDISNIVKGLTEKIEKNDADALNSVTNFDLGFGGVDFISPSDWLGFFPTSSGCTGSINTTIFGRPFVVAPCARLAPLREALAWVFSIYFLIALFKMAFTVRVNN